MILSRFSLESLLIGKISFLKPQDDIERNVGGPVQLGIEPTFSFAEARRVLLPMPLPAPLSAAVGVGLEALPAGVPIDQRPLPIPAMAGPAASREDPHHPHHDAPAGMRNQATCMTITGPASRTT